MLFLGIITIFHIINHGAGAAWLSFIWLRRMINQLYIRKNNPLVTKLFFKKAPNYKALRELPNLIVNLPKFKFFKQLSMYFIITFDFLIFYL